VQPHGNIFQCDQVPLLASFCKISLPCWVSALSTTVMQI